MEILLIEPCELVSCEGAIACGVRLIQIRSALRMELLTAEKSFFYRFVRFVVHSWQRDG
jgi:hypothetical protein